MEELIIKKNKIIKKIEKIGSGYNLRQLLIYGTTVVLTLIITSPNISIILQLFLPLFVAIGVPVMHGGITIYRLKKMFEEIYNIDQELNKNGIKINNNKSFKYEKMEKLIKDLFPDNLKIQNINAQEDTVTELETNHQNSIKNIENFDVLAVPNSKDNTFVISSDPEEEIDETKVTFEEHKIDNKKFYRLHYINYHNIGESYGYHNQRGEIDIAYKPFELPNGMTKEDAFKVLSYLTDFIERRPDIDECSLKSVNTLDSVLNLERFEFKRLDFKPSDDDIIDLFTIDGRIHHFKKSKYYSKYFNWYIPKIPKEEVEAICQKCGMIFKDIVWLTEEKRTTPLAESIEHNIENFEQEPDVAFQNIYEQSGNNDKIEGQNNHRLVKIKKTQNK